MVGDPNVNVSPPFIAVGGGGILASVEEALVELASFRSEVSGDKEVALL